VEFYFTSKTTIIDEAECEGFEVRMNALCSSCFCV